MKTINFAKNLRELRKIRKVTQRELALVLGVDQRTVSAWEHEICEPSFTLLAAICDYFDETFDSILT